MIDREKFPDRRPSVTQKVSHEFTGGKTINVLVTFGFHSYVDRRIREIFCADFKSGTDYHTLIIDASILVSRLLQMGLTPKHLLASLSEPRSIIGTIIQAAAEVEDALVKKDDEK